MIQTKCSFCMLTPMLTPCLHFFFYTMFPHMCIHGCKHRCKHSLCLYHPLWDFYSKTAVSYLHLSVLCLYHPVWDFYSNTVVSYLHWMSACIHTWFLFHQLGLSHKLTFLSSLHQHENVQHQFYWKVKKTAVFHLR